MLWLRKLPNDGNAYKNQLITINLSNKLPYATEIYIPNKKQVYNMFSNQWDAYLLHIELSHDMKHIIQKLSISIKNVI